MSRRDAEARQHRITTVLLDPGWVSTDMGGPEAPLTPEQSVDVIAYILKENDMPAGKTKLPADEAALKAIRIQLR